MSSNRQSSNVFTLRIIGRAGNASDNAEFPPHGAASREKTASRRARFIRHYEAVRRADIEGDFSSVYSGCKTGLELLQEGNLFGPNQQRVELALKRRIATIRSGGSFPRHG